MDKELEDWQAWKKWQKDRRKEKDAQKLIKKCGARECLRCYGENLNNLHLWVCINGYGSE